MAQVKGTLLNAYQIVSELGSGGMGKVYKATVAEQTAGLEAGTEVAIKVIHPHLLETADFLERFEREAQIGQQLRHENVVRTHDCCTAMREGTQQRFLVMEYVAGQTIRDLQKDLQRVPEELCRHIGAEVAAGLEAIHALGVVHRDIKPENVLITEAHVVKVMDLGVAYLQDAAIRLSQTGTFSGSVEYAAPEQFGAEPADARADLYALGVMLHELATGRHPFRDANLHKMIARILEEDPRPAGEVNPQLSPFFEELIQTLIQKSPGDRVQSAAEVAALLQAGEESEWWQGRAKALRLQTRQPLRRIRVPRETALYGRVQDLERLRGFFETACAGEGQVVLVEGEAGIGKTRLVDEFVGQLRHEGERLNFLFGSYPPGGAATALGAFSTAFREQFGEAGLVETLEDYLQPTPILVPAFAALLRGEGTPTGAEPLTKDAMQTVFVHATRALAKEHPTIILVDDLHFAPEEGCALFASLAAAIHGCRVLLIGTSRPGIADDWVANLERQGHVARLPLARLGPKDLVHMLGDAFHSERLAKRLGAQIAVKSDGNPFFALEIIRGLREGDLITQGEDGSWASTQLIEEIQIPSSVVDLIQARLADLSDEEKDLLEVASCCGFEFDPLVVAEAAGLARIPALRLLGRIETRYRLVRSAGRRLVFDAHQVQESLYCGIHEALRAEYHASIAEALETRARAMEKDPADLDGALAAQLSEHYFLGDRFEQGLRYLEAALAHLEEGYRSEKASALADKALEVEGLLTGVRRAEILLRKGRHLYYLGRRDAQEAVLEEARQLAEASDDKALQIRVEIAMSRLLEELSRYEESLACGQRAQALAKSVGDAEGEAGAVERLGRITHYQGDYVGSRAHFEDALERHKRLGNWGREASVLNALGLLAREQGDPEGARALWERCLEISARSGGRPVEIAATGNLAGLDLHEDRLERAMATLGRVVQLAREVGDRSREGFSAGMRGLLLSALGDPGAAREELERAMVLAHEMNDLRLRGYWLEGLAAVADEVGEDLEAERLSHESIALRREIGHRYGLSESLGAVGARLVRRGRHEEARPLLEEGLTIARELQLPQQVIVVCDLARFPGGDVGRALEAFQAYGHLLAPHEARVVRLALFEMTGDAAHLAVAHGLLRIAIAQAPKQYRESIVEQVRVNREVMRAWQARAGK